MDWLSQVMTRLEDWRELPRHNEIRAELTALAPSFRTMGWLCRDQAEAIPDRIALRFEAEEVSYAAYNQGVNRYANLLQCRGVEQGDVVNLMMENSPDFLMAQGACAKVGAIGALINHHIEGEALLHVHRVSGAKVALIDRASSAALLPLATRLAASGRRKRRDTLSEPWTTLRAPHPSQEGP